MWEAGGLQGQDVFVLSTGPSALSQPLGSMEGPVWGTGEALLVPGAPRFTHYTFERHEGWERYSDMVPDGCVRFIYHDDFRAKLGPACDATPDAYLESNTMWPLHKGYVGGVDNLDFVGWSPSYGLSEAVQPAIWGRPRSINLVGFDFTRYGKAFLKKPKDRGEGWDVGGDEWRMTMEGLEVLKDTCDSLGIALYNRSAETTDCVLPRAPLAEVIG